MKMLKKYENINFPAWALVDDDYTGLSDKYIALLEAFDKEWLQVTKAEGGTHYGKDTTGEASFAHLPAFGPACDCFQMTIYIWEK